MIAIIPIEAQRFRRMQKGEQGALDFFFHAHYKPLAYFAYTILGDTLEAEDVATEAFIKLWNHREALEKPGSIKAFLYTTVKNACINALRKRKVVAKHAMGFPQELNLLEQTTLHRMIEAELLRNLLDSRKVLPPKARVIFELIYIEGKSIKEIARDLKISISTVKSQRARAIQILKKQFPYITVLLYCMENGNSTLN
ncbi:MAG: polymerase sigma-70 factor [Flaviaesturariibacter sp.]|nr:polymerase sigma-70 factor [Flaviaesturariibacter sp.]